jgi:DNA repair exonuclease SbcCD ATPase subunit
MATTADSPPQGIRDDDLNPLYHGPPEEFTAARNELAKSLRSDGKREAADWVKALTKPSRAAWLVNQLAVRKPDEIAELLETGRELRAAQEDMLAGSTDREKLREAAHREQQIVDSLLRTAEVIGREHGVGAPILTRVGETLQAASSDAGVAEAIEAGRLTREQRASGIGVVGPATPVKPARKPARAEEREERDRRERQQLAKRRKEAERKLASAEKRLERERQKLERARDAVEEAERRVHAAELDAHAARRAHDEL